MVEYIGGDKGCLDRLNASIAQSKLERHPKFVWCTNPTCGQGQVHTEEDPMVTCNHCHAQSCFVHRVPWHQDLTCEQYTIGANEEYIGTHTKRCPNPVCSLPIEKSYGCDYMMCRCGHQFCWACMADFSIIFQQGTDHHNLNCPHYNPTGAIANPPAPPRRNRQPAFRNRSRLVAAAKLLTRKIGRLVSSARGPSYRQI
ncbi:IBR domain containing protein [Rhizoctonia solani AG-1 IB]|uniref:RBR-type E3 ubiquitin transferase n=1 Tax=Thanatephorus cucumeris (strain AG1-IB / isolate 7/3/14) TaxID=1108050 RepID=A0A0B7FZC4_THACB|nr:IBR domain containing protein [Rhizoctonia solani AG-1 IB]